MRSSLGDDTIFQTTSNPMGMTENVNPMGHGSQRVKGSRYCGVEFRASLLVFCAPLTYRTCRHCLLLLFLRLIILVFCFARDSIYAKRAYAIAIPSVCLSVRLSVCLSDTRVDQSKSVKVRIMQFSPYSSPIPVVFAR